MNNRKFYLTLKKNILFLSFLMMVEPVILGLPLNSQII